MPGDKYIIVKDRGPFISELINDCTITCGKITFTKGETLTAIIGKLCAKIDYDQKTYVKAGDNTTVLGVGSLDNPYIISSIGGSSDATVGLTMPHGFTASSPITGSGTINVTTSLLGILAGDGTGVFKIDIGPGLNYSGGILSSTISTSLLDSPSIDFTYDSLNKTTTAAIVTTYARNLFSSTVPITYNPTTGIFGTTLFQYTTEMAQDDVATILEANEFIYDDATPKISIREISALKITGTKPISFISDFPVQTGHAGEFLTTNGTALSFTAIPGGANSVDIVGVPDLNTLRAYDYYSTPSGTNERPSGTEKTLVQLLGRYSSGDGGGGTFYWDAASTEAEDGGTIVKPTAIGVGAGRWKRIFSGPVNVKWFGAKADGVTDSKFAFDAALAAFYNIFIPEGTYYISDTITISVPKIIEGIREKSIIQVAANKNGLNILIAASETFLKDFTLQSQSDINVPTMKTSLVGEGIHGRGILRGRGLRIQYFPSHGMNLEANLFLPTNHPAYGNTSNSTFELCNFYYNGGHGVFIQGDDASNMVFTGCDFRTNGRAGYFSHAFLGNHVNNSHNASNTARAGNRSVVKIAGTYYCLMDQMRSFVNHAGTSYRAILDSINIEPAVTSGWASYWVAVTTIPGLENWSIGGAYIKQKKPGTDAGWQSYWAIMPSVEFDNIYYTPAWDDNNMYLNGGAYVENNLNGFGVHTGTYSEGGQAPSWYAGQNLVLGGDHAAGWWTPYSILGGVVSPEMLPLGGSMSYSGWRSIGIEPGGKYLISMDTLGLGLKEGDDTTGTFWLKDIFANTDKVFRRQYANSVMYRTWDITTFYTDPTRFGRTLPFSPGQPNEIFAAKMVIPGEFHEDWGTSQAVHFSFGAAAPTTGEWRVGDYRIYCGSNPNIIGYKCTVSGAPGTWITQTLSNATAKSVADITALQAYAGISEVLLVSDSLTGGTFYYSIAALTADAGTIFAATGKGSGFWVRAFNKNEGINASWWGVTTNNTTSTNNTKINAALTYAVANNIKKVRLTGTIALDSGTGALFNLTLDGIEIYGDGINKTILIYPNVAINAATQVFQMSGNDQWIHDLAIQNLAQSGSNDWQGIKWADGTFRPRVSNYECYGIYGNGTAGGAGIASSMSWNTPQFTTTLGSTFASGSQVATPASMSGIHIGSQIHVAGTAEDVVVTAITQTTFTATYINAHNAADVVTIYSQGHQFGLVENCYIRDSWKASGIVLNSSSNIIKSCKIENIGSATTQHGVYLQAGNNEVSSNVIRGITGYGIHGHKAVSHVDASGDKYLNNLISDCRQSAIVVDKTANSTSNTQYPNGASLNRFNLIEGNTFRNSLGFLPSSAVPLLDIQAPSRIIGNVFEDTYTTANEAIVFSGTSDGSIFTSNRMNQVNTTTGTTKAIKVGVSNIIVSDNVINFGQSQINADKVTWSGNKITDGKLVLDGNHLIVSDNTIDNASVDAFGFINTHSNIVIEGNKFTSSGSAIVGNFDFTNITNTTFRGNTWVGSSNYLRYSNPNATIDLIGNQGGISHAGNAVVEQTFGSGRLIMYPFGASASISAGQVVKFTGGVLVKAATSDTMFDAIATSTLGSSATNAFFVAQPGAIVRVNTTGAWTIGNYAILSTSSAGTLKDGGTTQPRNNYSFGRFLDSGGGTGVATVLIIQLRTSTEVIFEHFQDAPNTTTAETDIFPETLPANTFNNDGEKVIADYAGTTVAHATATRQIRAYFGGTLVYDSTAIATTVIAHWSVQIKTIRASSSIVRVWVNFKLNSGGTNLRDETTYTEVTGLTLTATQVLKLTGTAAATGAATNDIVGRMAEGFWYPAVSVAV